MNAPCPQVGDHTPGTWHPRAHLREEGCGPGALRAQEVFQNGMFRDFPWMNRMNNNTSSEFVRQRLAMVQKGTLSTCLALISSLTLIVLSHPFWAVCLRPGLKTHKNRTLNGTNLPGFT